MTYSNPQIIKLDGAIKAIQHVDCKCVPQVLDGFPSDPLYPQLNESPAYQADE